MPDKPLASSTNTTYSVTLPSRGPTVHVLPKKSDELDLEPNNAWDDRHGMGRGLEETRQYVSFLCSAGPDLDHLWAGRELSVAIKLTYNLDSQSTDHSRRSLSSHPLSTSPPPVTTTTTAFTNGILPPRGFFAPQKPGVSTSSNGLHIPSTSSPSTFHPDPSTSNYTYSSPQSSLEYTSDSIFRPQQIHRFQHKTELENEVTNRYGDPDGMHGSDHLPSGVSSSPSKGESLYVASTPSKVYGPEGRWREVSEDTQFGSSSTGRRDDVSGMDGRFGRSIELGGRGVGVGASPTASREPLIWNQPPSDFEPSVMDLYPYQLGVSSSNDKTTRPDPAARTTSSRQKLFNIKRHSVMSTISSRPSSQPPQPIDANNFSSSHPSTPLGATTTAFTAPTVLPPGVARKRIRKHKLHQGHNSFALGGRLITGGGSTPFALLISVIVEVGLGALWVGTTGVYVWRKGVGGRGGGSGIAVVMVFLWMWGVSFGAMMGTAFRDPGIIPRNLDPSPMVAPTVSTGSLVPLPKELRVRSGRVTVKYCETCCIYRPPRSSHCRLCGNCVESIDHHCTYLHTCDGGRSFRRALSKDPGSAVAFSLSILLIGPVGTLMSYHIRLMFKNSTTIEEIRRSAIRSTEGSKKTNVFLFWRHRGHSRRRDRSDENLYASPFRFAHWYTNVSRMLCRPNTPSWMGFSDWVEDTMSDGQKEYKG
ncbi:DHHC-type Zn-finger proteins [Phaffia rhodozyma]|uniref:Palmitoyltransferase n=1 Tax=Phaffia rhodozyma TaxID=264483 RepID=A0A0F7SPF4_PHARH|nr:DHHC-type Zn-finger proteins [Phaffia rhodozyma]